MKKNNSWKAITTVGLVSTILKMLVLVICALYIFISSYEVLFTANSGFAAFFVVLAWGIALIALAIAAYYFITGIIDFILSIKCVSIKKRNDIMIMRYVFFTFNTIGTVVECVAYISVSLLSFEISEFLWMAIAMLFVFLLRLALGILDLVLLILADRRKYCL